MDEPNAVLMPSRRHQHYKGHERSPSPVRRAFRHIFGHKTESEHGDDEYTHGDSAADQSTDQCLNNKEEETHDQEPEQEENTPNNTLYGVNDEDQDSSDTPVLPSSNKLPSHLPQPNNGEIATGHAVGRLSSSDLLDDDYIDNTLSWYVGVDLLLGEDYADQGTVLSETPSEKVNNQLTLTNTVKNLEITLDEEDKEDTKKTSNEVNTMLKVVVLSKKSELRKSRTALKKRLKQQQVMFYVPDKARPKTSKLSYKWRVWLPKEIKKFYPIFNDDFSRFKPSRRHCKGYKSHKSHYWANLKNDMELISDMLEDSFPEPEVSHVFKHREYPTDENADFRNSHSLYIPLTVDKIRVLVFSITNIIANECDYVFYDKNFEIDLLRRDILGITFLKSLGRVTMKIWLKSMPVVRLAGSSARSDATRISDLCQLLFDGSNGELFPCLVHAVFGDNRYPDERERFVYRGIKRGTV